MTYTRPSYSDLNDRISADLAAVPAVLREPLAVMWARVGHGLHGHLDWVHAQCSPLTCDEDRLYDWGGLYGVPRLTAVAATGAVMATGTAGAVVLAESVLRATNGLDYSVVSAVDIGAGATAVDVRCTTTGEAGNLPAGAVLELVDPLTGVASAMTVGASGISGGADAEVLDAWRLRVADEWQTVTTTGARSGKIEDYRAWAKSAHPSVTGALVQPHVLGVGTVLVRPICNGLTNRLPTQGVLDAVAAFFADVVPANADWRVAAPIVRTVTPALHLLPGYDTAGNRSAIFTAIEAVVLAEDLDGATLLEAEIDGAIQTVTSQYDRIAPDANITAGAGEVFVLAPIVWS